MEDQNQTNPPTLADFDLTEEQVESAEAIKHNRIHVWLPEWLLAGIFLVSIAIGLYYGFTVGGYKGPGIGAAIGFGFVGFLCACGINTVIAILCVIVQSILSPSVSAEVKDTLSSYRRFKDATKAYETEQRQKQADYWASLTGIEFEHEVAAIYTKLGKRAKVTPASGDAGIDIRITEDDSSVIVQCKRYKHPAPPAAARELYGALKSDGADKAILVCTGGFTSGVHKFVKDKPIELIDMDGLLKLVERVGNK